MLLFKTPNINALYQFGITCWYHSGDQLDPIWIHLRCDGIAISMARE